VDGKPIECREVLKNDTVSKDASSYMAILHGRGAMPRVGLNPAKRSTQGHPHKTSKNLILADAGGSNSCRSRVWKAQLQEQLCDACGLAVTVCHYPSSCSKWNPIEHRLFSFISLNWAGLPLRTFDMVVRSIAGNVTAAGLRVTACLKRGGNETGELVSNADMRRLHLTPHPVCPAWNYTLSPRTLWADD
jgi:hypothetical protein